MDDKAEATLTDTPSYMSVNDSVGEPYCFESDHVALKDNPDYHKLLRTICLLEAQRAKAIEDLEVLHEAQEKVMEDPVGFVDKLQRNADLGIPLPVPQKLVELPAIDWEKYTNSVDFASFGTHRQSARLKRNEALEDENLLRLKSSLTIGTDSGDGSEGFVRGRFKTESKSVTFNKLWTPEEQKRLDELLVMFPPEEVEARRWRKIAAAFGDRTPQQIASRVQKYFEKLERAKLPIPGRVPNRVVRVKKTGHRHQRHNWMYRDSTFLQRYKPPVLMKDDDEDEYSNPGPSGPPSEHSFMDVARGGYLDGGAGSEERVRSLDSSDDEEVPEDLRETAEFRELQQLKKLRQERLTSLDPTVPLHTGYKCDKCGCEPIVGTRYHCVDCPSTTSLDFCESCVDNLGSFDSASHNSSHRVRPVKRTWNRQTPDQDYLSFENSNLPGSYNYLDPNYMPAV